MERGYTAAPVETAADRAAATLCDTGFMNRLAQVGDERRRGATPWETT
jgi:hypothetical protein